MLSHGYGWHDLLRSRRRDGRSRWLQRLVRWYGETVRWTTLVVVPNGASIFSHRVDVHVETLSEPVRFGNPRLRLRNGTAYTTLILRKDWDSHSRKYDLNGAHPDRKRRTPRNLTLTHGTQHAT
jgi:hypothetical protein